MKSVVIGCAADHRVINRSVKDGMVFVACADASTMLVAALIVNCAVIFVPALSD